MEIGCTLYVLTKRKSISNENPFSIKFLFFLSQIIIKEAEKRKSFRATKIQIYCNSYYFLYLYSADMPIVTLKMGSSLNPDDIKEGDDVYFECLIQSNPKPYKMSWFHNVSNS
jgi:hypothetical protein